MRRFFSILLALLAIFSLSLTAFGTTGLKDVTTTASLASDGSCQVAITGTITIDDPEDLTFPLPQEAARIYVNGSRRVSSKTVGNLVLVDLERAYKQPGTYPLNISYELRNCIVETENGLFLQLPMLSGFSYPIENFSFTVTLPGENKEKPAFSSGYHQANIEKDLDITSHLGSTISGTALIPLKDHETLVMTLPVTEEMFPQTRIAPPSLTFCITAIWICIILAFLYWLIFLRCLPPAYMKSTTAPEGCTAGELGSILCGTGTDLTMMVFSWAQLGYLHIDAMSRKVILYQQMEMGNERSSYERKIFQNLFRGKKSVDTTSLHYATMARELAGRRPGMPNYFHPKSGNPVFFRWICATIALFAGIGIGISMTSGSILQWLWGTVIAALAAWSGMRLQRLCEGIFLRQRHHLYESLILSAIWLILGMAVGQTNLALTLVVTQLLCSFFLYFGGRRTDAGKTAMSQTLGLQRYLRGIRKDDLQRITATQPDFFHTAAPWAFALGVHRQFARHFGKRRLPPCPYITLNTDAHLTATQWCAKIEKIIGLMDARQKQLPLEKIVKFLASLKK